MPFDASPPLQDPSQREPVRIGADTLLPLHRYQQQRAGQRAAAIAHRRARSLALGPTMTLQFEDEASVRYQIQEVMHAECIVAAADVQDTIDRFAHLLGNGHQWHATLFIELPDAQRRLRELPALSDAAHHLYLGCGALPRVVASANDDLADRHRGRPSAVHFLRFALPPAHRAALRAGQPVLLGCAHRAYAWQRPLPAALQQALCRDLSGDPCD